ncbi:MAG: hypothetical protein JRI64_10850 [Deltaproteobacteria bacterium]|nr:hypothetical protein [Deltaproteobacteria bacterium]
MITDILYRCPECGGFEWLIGNRCKHCGVGVEILSRQMVAINGRVESIAHWYQKVRGQALLQNVAGELLNSRRIKLSREIEKGSYKGLSGIHAVQYGRQSLAEGKIILHRDKLVFHGPSMKISIHFERVSSVTIESNTVILDRKGGRRALYFDFQEESGKKWEDCIHFQPGRNRRVLS